jgi:hypothetical protein
MKLTKQTENLISCKVPSDTKTTLARAAGLVSVWVAKRKDARKEDESAAMLDLRYPFIQLFGATTASSLLDAPPSEDHNELFRRMFRNCICEHQMQFAPVRDASFDAISAVPTVEGLN